MKSFLLFVALVCAVMLSTSTPTATQAAAGGKEQAVVVFREPVKLMGTTLKGEYLFVHNDETMARGEACTFVYQGPAEVPRKLVVSFHCIPALRDRVGYFTMRSVTTGSGQELTEYQFAGSTEAHMVPSHGHAGHVGHVSIPILD